MNLTCLKVAVYQTYYMSIILKKALTIQLQILTIYGHKEVTIFDEFSKVRTQKLCVVELRSNRLITSIYIIEFNEIDSMPLSMRGELVTK